MSDAMREPVYYGPMACCGEVHGGWESPCPTLVKLREAVSRYGSESDEFPTWGTRIGGIDEWARVFAAAFPSPAHLARHQERVARPTLDRFAPHDGCAPDCKAPDAPAHKPALGSPPVWAIPSAPERGAETDDADTCACEKPSRSVILPHRCAACQKRVSTPAAREGTGRHTETKACPDGVACEAQCSGPCDRFQVEG